MYELLFSSQQPIAVEFRGHCCNVAFTSIQQQLTDKIVDDQTHEYQNAIEAIQYENVGLQGKRLVIDQKIATLQRCYMGYLENEDKKMV